MESKQHLDGEEDPSMTRQAAKSLLAWTAQLAVAGCLSPLAAMAFHAIEPGMALGEANAWTLGIAALATAAWLGAPWLTDRGRDKAEREPLSAWTPLKVAMLAQMLLPVAASGATAGQLLFGQALAWALGVPPPF